ncbi:LacI family DNA-binding transcriptional regulator [Primorskyibacter sedentarius]|uniref:LacI family DNA-binding transcriptional regulator n=1 Tax=Primorskyibacter sedentarius TaxID=745311 RepID=UPI003EBCEFCD
MATIYDVAKKAGVSPKTVSRVLNGDAPVNKNTRAAVTRAISDLDYVPSQAARTMRSKKSGLIGLITGAISHAPEPAAPTGLPDLLIVQAIQKELASQGKILMIADTGDTSETVPLLARTFAQHRVDGLIYVADHHREVDIKLSDVGCPTILVNCFDKSGTLCVLPDDRAGMESLVTRLIQAGHERIGFLSLDPEMSAAQLRLEGYQAAHAASGLSSDPALIAHVHASASDESQIILSAALEKLLSVASPPTVICCGNDVMAMRVYGLLNSRGLRVPDDISIAGFDDHRAISEVLTPQLTTVELPYAAMGRFAAQLMLDVTADNTLQPRNPNLVRGTVAWRSSVTKL